MDAVLQRAFAGVFSCQAVCIFFIQIWLKFVPDGLINSKSALVEGNGLAPNDDPILLMQICK